MFTQAFSSVLQLDCSIRYENRWIQDIFNAVKLDSISSSLIPPLLYSFIRTLCATFGRLPFHRNLLQSSFIFSIFCAEGYGSIDATYINGDIISVFNTTLFPYKVRSLVLQILIEDYGYTDPQIMRKCK